MGGRVMTWGFSKVCAALALAIAGMSALPAPAHAKPRAEALSAAKPITLKLELRGTAGDPSWFALAAPNRLVIDVPGARTDRGDSEGKGFVTRVRLAQFEPGTARVVVELASPARVSEARIVDGSVEVTLAPTTAADFARLPALGRFAAVPPVASDRPAPLLAAGLLPAGIGEPAAAPQRPRRGVGTLPLVVIDAGHGGHDVGAISVFEGRHEKDATLAIARAIARELERGGRVRVKLTREGDTFIPLEGRVRIARRLNADFFLSIHADAAPNPEATGATVYTLSDVASDKMAARVAARENRSGLVNGVELNGEDPEVAGILFSLAQRGTMNLSADFAQALQRGMEPDVPFRQNFHRFAGFAVLRTGDIPAVLLETGYVTNEADARFLFSESGQQAIAKGVARAIEARFPQHVANRGADTATGVGRGTANR